MDVASMLIRFADSYCAFVRRIGRATRALDDHWIGDLIAVICLFASLWVGLVAGWVLQ